MGMKKEGILSRVAGSLSRMGSMFSDAMAFLARIKEQEKSAAEALKRGGGR